MTTIYHRLFSSYPYKQFQLKFLKLPPDLMALHYGKGVEKDLLKRSIGPETEPSGLLSLSPLGDFSQAMGFPVYLLKNYLIRHPEAAADYRKLEEQFKAVLRELPAHHCLVAKLPLNNARGIRSLGRWVFITWG